MATPKGAQSSGEYYDILLVGKAGMGKSTTGNKILGIPCVEDADRPLFWPRFFAGTGSKGFSVYRGLQRDYLPQEKCEVHANDQTKIRVLEVPSFSDDFGEQGRRDESRIQNIFLSILAMKLKIRRVIYFLPVRGTLEKIDGELREDLEIMDSYFGGSIFKVMIVVATCCREYQDIWDDKRTKVSKRVFEMGIRLATGLEIGCPPLIFIRYDSTGEEIMRNVRSATVIHEGAILPGITNRKEVRCRFQEQIKILQDRMRQLDRRIEQAEGRADAAEQRSCEANQKRNQAEREREEAQRKATSCEEQRTQAERRRNQAEIERNDAQRKAASWKEREAKSMVRMNDAEHRAREATERNGALEKRVEELQTRLTHSGTEREEAVTRARRAERMASIRVSEEEKKKREAENRRLAAEAGREVAEQARRQAERGREVAERKMREAERERDEAERARREAEDRANAAIRRISSGEEPSWVVQRAEIHLTEEELGRGAWAVVKVAKFRGIRVAAKCLHQLIVSDYNRRLFTREMNLAAKIRHPNLLLFIGSTYHGDLIILTELMPTTLRAVLEQGPLTAAQQSSIALDVAAAINYLHLMRPDPILHRDISSSNVLLEPQPDNKWQAKVSDYGTANFLKQLQTKNPGSPVYAAPEAELPSQQSTKMDIFSFGVLLVEMFTAQFPDVSEREELIQSITDKRVVRIIRQCTAQDRNRRPTTAQVITELSLL